MTRTALMETLPLVMLEEGLGDLTHLLQRGFPMPLEALFTVASLGSFDKRVLVWPMRRTDGGFDPQTEQETAQRRRNISPCAATNESGDHDQRSFDAGDRRSAKR